jgi:hypothetical protein
LSGVLQIEDRSFQLGDTVAQRAHVSLDLLEPGEYVAVGSRRLDRNRCGAVIDAAAAE